MTGLEPPLTPNEYWAPLVRLAMGLRCWSRVAAALKPNTAAQTSPWGTLLCLPVTGYLEGSHGPVPIRLVEWVQLSTAQPRGGRFGLPLQFVDIAAELIENVKNTERAWELRDELWSVDGVFENRPVLVIHLPNPCRDRAA